MKIGSYEDFSSEKEKDYLDLIKAINNLLRREFSYGESMNVEVADLIQELRDSGCDPENEFGLSDYAEIDPVIVEIIRRSAPNWNVEYFFDSHFETHTSRYSWTERSWWGKGIEKEDVTETERHVLVNRFLFSRR